MFKSVTPDVGEEAQAYVTPESPERKWWELHKYSLTELAALTSIVTFVWRFTGAKVFHTK